MEGWKENQEEGIRLPSLAPTSLTLCSWGHCQLTLAAVPSHWVLTPLLISKAPSLPANSNTTSLLYSWGSQVLGTREGAQEVGRGHY